MAAKKRRQLMLDCDICGEPVVLSPARYVELIREGKRPRCRRNGCERLCGAKNTGTARVSEVLIVLDVPLRKVNWPRAKRGNRNGALAKLRVTRDQQWRLEGGDAVPERNET